MATGQHDKERQLQRDVARTVESTLPGVEVLALELTGRARGAVLSAGPSSVQIENGTDPADIPYDQIVRANLIDEGNKS